jgi:hypothetical protein
VAIVALTSLRAAPATAEGPIEINQQKVLASGGFPYVLSQPRKSYRLTGNLVLPAGPVEGIRVTASDVTLDLNGFAIGGPDNGAPGINVLGSPENLVIRNGSVVDRGGIVAGARARIEQVYVRSSGTYGIFAGDMAQVIESRVGGSNVAGIRVGAASIVRGCMVRDSADDGIVSGSGSLLVENRSISNDTSLDGIGLAAGSGALVRGNFAWGNSSDGISGGDACAVIGNHVARNQGYGLALTSSCGYVNNFLSNNVLGPFDDPGLGMSFAVSNFCGVGVCPNDP